VPAEVLGLLAAVQLAEGFTDEQLKDFSSSFNCVCNGEQFVLVAAVLAQLELVAVFLTLLIVLVVFADFTLACVLFEHVLFLVVGLTVAAVLAQVVFVFTVVAAAFTAIMLFSAFAVPVGLFSVEKPLKPIIDANIAHAAILDVIIDIFLFFIVTSN
jgi:hypothetical protein